MSKGHGLIMTRVLEELERQGGWVPAVDLAADIEGNHTTRVNRSAEESTKRACHRLAQLGFVELAYQSMSTGRILDTAFKRSGTHRAQLIVRRSQAMR